MYKKRLISLLEGLECQQINKLIEKSPEHLKAVGIEIAKYTKIGAESDVAVLTSAKHSDGEERCSTCGGKKNENPWCSNSFHF